MDQIDFERLFSTIEDALTGIRQRVALKVTHNGANSIIRVGLQVYVEAEKVNLFELPSFEDRCWQLADRFDCALSLTTDRTVAFARPGPRVD